VDLSEYAGKEIQLRFEYITDAAVNGEGLMVDDIRIPETGYFEDFEQGDGGWEAAGFVRIHNQIPQTYKVTLIQTGSNGTTITPIKLDENQHAAVDLNIESGYNATLVISGTTRFTRQPAGYTFQVE